LVFRIEPPLFQYILQSRVQMALNSITQKGSRILSYALPNGMHVDYPASEQAYYLSSIMRSIFEHGLHVRRLIVGLSGRNMRRALEIFLEFCTSGHISEAEFLKIRQSKGQYVLPLHLVTTVLLRLNQRYYDSDHAYLKSLFHIDEHDSRRNYFSRLMILRMLAGRMETFGPKRLKGYEHVGVLRRELAAYGVEETIFMREIESLVRGFCVVTEDFRVENLTDDDLVALAPAGLVHTQMMTDIYYLAAVAEDSWFQKKATAEDIANRIKDEELHFTNSTVFHNASSLLEVMASSREIERAAIASFRDPAVFDELTDLQKSQHSLGLFEKAVVPPPWYGSKKRYPIDSVQRGVIKAVKKFGMFIEMEAGLDAIAPASMLPNDFDTDDGYRVGDTIKVRIVSLDQVARRMAVRLAVE